MPIVACLAKTVDALRIEAGNNNICALVVKLDLYIQIQLALLFHYSYWFSSWPFWEALIKSYIQSALFPIL